MCDVFICNARSDKEKDSGPLEGRITNRKVEDGAVQKLQTDKGEKQSETPTVKGGLAWLLQTAIIPFIIGMAVPAIIYEKPAFGEVDKEKLETSVIPETRLRSVPKELSKESVKAMLNQHNFFCSEYDWSEEYCNPDGRGFDNKFENKNNGRVVYDHASGLMWQQSGSEEYMTYRKAMAYIAKLNSEQFAGYGEWRLPTLEEAMSLMEPTEIGGYLYLELLYIDQLFDKTQLWIWTSDLYDTTSAWMVSFDYGFCGRFFINDNCYIRAVR